MNRLVRIIQVVAGSLALVLAVGFFLQTSWALSIWPWPTSRLSNIFISSIMAAIGAPVVWIGLSGEEAAVTGGALNLGVTYLGGAIFSFQSYARAASRPVLVFGIACAALAALCIGLIVWSLRLDFADSRPLPVLVRISFAVFCVTLVLVGGALVLKRPRIFPWPLSDEQSVLYGWIFLGAACYFLYAVLKPGWGNAQGQLLGFLAYDLVLIVPFIQHFATVTPDLRLSLTVYTSVVVYSGLLAAFYLFANPATRLGATRAAAA